MNRILNRSLCSALLVWLAVHSAPLAAGALEDYVHRPDPAYDWSLYHRESGWSAKFYFLRLQSQHWLNAELVDRPLWEHEIRIVQPRPLFCGDKAQEKTAILVISGGSNRERGMTREVPTHAGALARKFCRTVVELRQVPNEPLTFVGEPRPRKGDAIIAYSFDRYLKGEQGDWPVQLAMVRSVVQAMTAVQEFSRTRKDVPDLDEFVLLGGSKRGWTAWLTAAVDKRVRALVPVSIDMASIGEQFPHHFASYGEYAPALHDYEAFDIGCRMAGERGRELASIIDPIAYVDRLTQPKLILNSAGDQFFVADSWRFYYDRLLGDKRLRYTVNSDHGHGGWDERIRLILHARNWIDDALAGRQPPELTWERGADGTLTVTATPAPREVRLWTADNPKARDFRLETLGPRWEAQELEPDEDGRYRVRLDEPKRGWRASLVEAVFGGWQAEMQQVYTTGVFVAPETLPHAPRSCETAPQTARREVSAR